MRRSFTAGCLVALFTLLAGTVPAESFWPKKLYLENLDPNHDVYVWLNGYFIGCVPKGEHCQLTSGGFWSQTASTSSARRDIPLRLQTIFPWTDSRAVLELRSLSGNSIHENRIVVTGDGHSSDYIVYYNADSPIISPLPASSSKALRSWAPVEIRNAPELLPITSPSLPQPTYVPVIGIPSTSSALPSIFVPAPVSGYCSASPNVGADVRYLTGSEWSDSTHQFVLSFRPFHIVHWSLVSNVTPVTGDATWKGTGTALEFDLASGRVKSHVQLNLVGERLVGTCSPLSSPVLFVRKYAD